MDTVTPADIQRLEAKLDKVTEAINKLVLVEERQITQNVRINGLDKDIAALTKAQADAEKSNTAEHIKTNARIDRFINQAVGAIAVITIAVEAAHIYFGK